MKRYHLPRKHYPLATTFLLISLSCPAMNKRDALLNPSPPPSPKMEESENLKIEVPNNTPFIGNFSPPSPKDVVKKLNEISFVKLKELTKKGLLKIKEFSNKINLHEISLELRGVQKFFILSNIREKKKERYIQKTALEDTPTLITAYFLAKISNQKKLLQTLYKNIFERIIDIKDGTILRECLQRTKKYSCDQDFSVAFTMNDTTLRKSLE